VLERLDGGTLRDALEFKNQIGDHHHRFWKRKKFSYEQVLKYARELAEAMIYCHHNGAITDGMLLHRDLKPDNIGFTSEGILKIFDFGLARVIHGSSPNDIDEYYDMSGNCGSLRYMAPEVALSKPYNHKVDVYSFAIILWEMLTFETPFQGMTREEFHQKVVNDRERPPINKKWPEPLVELMTSCWR
jgi:serine/threonine protein kinase